MEDASMLGLLGRLVFSLAVVLFLMFLLARVMRNKNVPSLGRGHARRDLLQVLARQTLTRSTSVAVVQAAGKALVVGVSDTGVTVLAEVDPDLLDPDEPDEGPVAPQPATWSGFVDLLRDRTVRRG